MIFLILRFIQYLLFSKCLLSFKLHEEKIDTEAHRQVRAKTKHIQTDIDRYKCVYVLIQQECNKYALIYVESIICDYICSRFSLCIYFHTTVNMLLLYVEFLFLTKDVELQSLSRLFSVLNTNVFQIKVYFDLKNDLYV